MEHALNLCGSSPTTLGSFSTTRHFIPNNKCYNGIYCANDEISSLFFDKFIRHYNYCNRSLPPLLSKTKKKPYPIPLKKILEASRADKKLAEMGMEKPLEPPKNGLLVPDLVPVAYEVLDAWKILIKGVSQLVHVVPVHACSECSKVRVCQTGHEIQNSHGSKSAVRRSFHLWVKGSINDVLLLIKSYHQYGPFGTRVKHETRFDFDRIPAIVELCIQAGLELPEYPSRIRTQPIRMLGKKVLGRGVNIEPPKASFFSEILELNTHGVLEWFPPPQDSDINAYEKVRWGVSKLLRKYTVKACGYCSEVHVGLWATMPSFAGSLSTNGETESTGGKMQQWRRLSRQITCGMFGIQKGRH